MRSRLTPGSFPSLPGPRSLEPNPGSKPSSGHSHSPLPSQGGWRGPLRVGGFSSGGGGGGGGGAGQLLRNPGAGFLHPVLLQPAPSATLNRPGSLPSSYCCSSLSSYCLLAHISLCESALSLSKAVSSLLQREAHSSALRSSQGPGTGLVLYRFSGRAVEIHRYLFSLCAPLPCSLGSLGLQSVSPEPPTGAPPPCFHKADEPQQPQADILPVSGHPPPARSAPSPTPICRPDGNFGQKIKSPE